MDNGSDDRTPYIVEEIIRYDERCTLFYKLGGTIASVRNYGFKHSKGEVLAFLDGDSVVSQEWSNIGVNILLGKEDISCVGFAVTPPLSSQSWVERTWFPISSSGKYKGTREVNWLSSFNLLIRHKSFEKAKGFDETLFTCEDVDLGRRLSAFSRLIFSDACKVEHLGTVKTVSEFLKKEYWRGQKSFKTFLKNSKKRNDVLSILIPLIYLFLIVVWMYLVLLVIFIGKGNIYLLLTSILITIIPLIMSMRSGVRTPKNTLNTSLLFVLYLIARGAAIVRCRS